MLINIPLDSLEAKTSGCLLHV